ncbi:hypothetical protein ACHAWU_003140 [Discostella pseudostelligera]|uniref:Uncharacterized protein n=1 Tax=Discostella pseudostelligera TaxID=259834 RepID=A0ABD3M4K0_9STRA
MTSFREREEFRPHADESLYSGHRSVGRSYSLPMKAPSTTDHRDHGGKRNCDRRIRRRCELYLALTLASLISISCIASSSSRSGMKTAAISFSSLSFIVTFIMGVGYFSRQMRDYLATNTLSSIQHGGRLRRNVTHEKIAVTIVMVLACIVSGLVLYPQFDTNPIAVAGNEIWNPNLFYINWISLYASAYLVANLSYNDGNYQSSMKSSWFMCLFSSICTATSLLIIQSGPACRGELIDETTYCSSALAAGSISVVCAIVLFVCGACYWQSVTIALRLQKLLKIVGATLLLVIQCVVVAVVTAPSGPGHETGNAFIASWMSFILSLRLWKNSVESCLMPPKQVRKSLSKGSTSSTSKGSGRGETKSTATTEDEGSSDEDRGNSCDYVGEVLTDIPTEVQAGGDDYWNNLRGPDPEEGLRNHSIYPNRRQAKHHQAHVDGNRVLEEADEVLFKVASYHSRSYVAKPRTSQKSPRDAAEVRSSHSISRREDPRGVRCNDSMHRKSRRRSQEHAKEPPSSREEATTQSLRPDTSKECLDHKQDFTFRIPPLPLTADGCPPPTNEEDYKVRLASLPKTDPPKTFTPTPPQRQASFVSNMSPVHETSHDGDTRRSSSPMSSENGESKNAEHIAGSRITTSSNGSSQNRRTPPTPPPPLPRARNEASRASSSKHREKKPKADEEISATKHSSSTGRSNKHNSSSERLFASFPSEPPRKSPDPEMGSVPFDVLLNDDQTVVTEITTPVSEFRYSIPTGTSDRKLSIAVAAALHAAAVSANTEKKAKATNEVVSDIFNTYKPKRSSRKERSLSPGSQRQQSVSLQSSNMFDGSVGSPLTEEISLISTLEQARNLRTYSDLEDSKLHIQGENIATNNSGIVGILKNNHDSGSHRKTPSNASSKLSGRASSPSKSSQKRYQEESDLVLRALSARMKGGHTEGASASILGSVGVNKSLPRRQCRSQQPSHNLSNAASLESRSRLASSSAERRGSMKSYFSVMDDSHTLHGEFEC